MGPDQQPALDPELEHRPRPLAEADPGRLALVPGPALSLVRGRRELLRLQRLRTFDLRSVDEAGFRPWLERHLAHWQRDPVFVQRCRIRDLRRSNPRLRKLERALQAAEAADAASPSFERLEQLVRELSNTGKAVEGLTGAQAGASAVEGPGLTRKLDRFLERRSGLEHELAELVAASPERQARLALAAELDALRRQTGLERDEARLRELTSAQGRRSSRSGQDFEALARGWSERVLAPELVRRRGRLHGQPAPLVLTGVTLGAAQTELDGLIVLPGVRPDAPVEVLAIVEAKRNPNDLGLGLLKRQANLTWLTGETEQYDPAQYRTRSFPTGHFDRPALHEHEGQPLVFTSTSFRRFRRDPRSGLFLDRLYLITREGCLWGLSASALARLRARVATDRHWAPDDPRYLQRLLRYARSLAGLLETPDVLELFASARGRGRQIVIARR